MTKRGDIVLTLIILGGIIILSSGAVVSLLISEHRKVDRSVAYEETLQIAEAGANYYRWVLSHDPTNYTGASQDYRNTSGDIIGHYSITVLPPSNGSTVVTITSTGWTTQYPLVKRTIQVRYGKPSYTQYAFLTNSNVWFGDTEAVHGRLHSNGGIRMDGVVDSIATSIKATYICGPEHGCNNEEKPGIWGTGQDPALWDFPVADALDFDSVTLDFQTMHDSASSGGIVISHSNDKGYHLVFNSNGTFSVYKVTKLQNPVWGYNGTDWTYESDDIKNETAVSQYQNHALPGNGIIFVEDNTWVTGQVNGRVTIAAAYLPEGTGTMYNIYIPDSITYYPDRTSGSVLGLIAQNDILVPLYSQTDLVIDAALLAQSGHDFRDYYYPPYYPADTVKNSIETYGTIITNTVWTWSWVDGSNTVVSGYRNSSTNYDPNLFLSPPPYFPTQDYYSFISWEEISQ